MLLLKVSITNGIAVSAVIEVVLFSIAAALTTLPDGLSLVSQWVNSLRVPGRHPAGATTISPGLERQGPQPVPAPASHQLAHTRAVEVGAGADRRPDDVGVLLSRSSRYRVRQRSSAVPGSIDT
jgi:hypothetical protein